MIIVVLLLWGLWSGKVEESLQVSSLADCTPGELLSPQQVCSTFVEKMLLTISIVVMEVLPVSCA